MKPENLKQLAEDSDDRVGSLEITARVADKFDQRLGDLTRAIAESYRARAVYIRSRLDEV
jgi:hypothetical protein